MKDELPYNAAVLFFPYEFKEMPTMPYLGVCQASPKECQSSVSLDDRQLDRSSMASWLKSGAMTRVGRLGTAADSWDASTINVSGENKKWTNSGAFGS